MNRIQRPRYPELERQMSKLGRGGISRIARALGISYVVLCAKRTGNVRFGFEEVVKMRDEFFPEVRLEDLMRREG